MRRELLEELLTAAQEVVNNSWAAAGDEYPQMIVDRSDFERLKAVVKAVSDDAVATIHILQRGGEEPDRAMIERIVGHPFTDEEWSSITKGIVEVKP